MKKFQALPAALIIILVAANLMLIINRSGLIKNINMLVHEKNSWKIKSKTPINESNYLLNATFTYQINESFVYDKLPPIYFVVFFKENDCSNCIRQEVEMLNVFHLPQVIGFFLKNNTRSKEHFIKSYGIKFPIVSVSRFPIQSVVIDKTPIIFVVNSRNEIIDSYEPQPNNLVKRNAFYTKWDRLVESLENFLEKTNMQQFTNAQKEKLTRLKGDIATPN